MTLRAGDVLIVRAPDGWRILNYRQQDVVDQPLPSLLRAVVLARELVAPWQGRIVLPAGLRDSGASHVGVAGPFDPGTLARAAL